MRRDEGRAQRGSRCCDLFKQAAERLNGQQCRSHLTASVPSCRANAALLTGVCRPNPPGQQPASPLASRRVPAGKSDFDGSGRACITGPGASGRGGTGRRAALRALWGKPRGSSTLLGRTKASPVFRARTPSPPSRCRMSQVSWVASFATGSLPSDDPRSRLRRCPSVLWRRRCTPG